LIKSEGESVKIRLPRVQLKKKPSESKLVSSVLVITKVTFCGINQFVSLPPFFQPSKHNLLFLCVFNVFMTNPSFTLTRVKVKFYQRRQYSCNTCSKIRSSFIILILPRKILILLCGGFSFLILRFNPYQYSLFNEILR
jgi:hypothetical protein